MSGLDAPRILIVGAGAIGGVVGAALMCAGEDVTLVDADVAHREAMRRQGLSIEGGPGAGDPGPHPVAVRALAPDALDGQFDVVFLAVKSQHTATALAPAIPHLAADGCVVSLQNGLNETLIASLVGRERVL